MARVAFLVGVITVLIAGCNDPSSDMTPVKNRPGCLSVDYNDGYHGWQHYGVICAPSPNTTTP